MGILYEGAIPEIALNVTWTEVHSDITYRADVTFSTDEIKGWGGGTVIVTFSFRPGGELVLYADGPDLAATRPGPDVDIRSGADMAAVLLAPGLGRAHRRGDYIELRRVCGTVDPDPPEAFRNGRAKFGPQTLAQIDANRSLPLPVPMCARAMKDEDADLLERNEAIASDTSPEAQADVTEPAEVCSSPKLTVGMFFNGTFNNAFNVSDDRDTPATGLRTGCTAAMQWAGMGVGNTRGGDPQGNTHYR